MDITIPNETMDAIFICMGATYKLEVAPHNRFKCCDCDKQIRKGTRHLSMYMEFFQATKMKRFCSDCTPRLLVQMQINCREFEKRIAG